MIYRKQPTEMSVPDLINLLEVIAVRLSYNPENELLLNAKSIADKEFNRRLEAA